MRHFLNVLGNFVAFWLPVILCSGMLVGLAFGAAHVLENYGY